MARAGYRVQQPGGGTLPTSLLTQLRPKLHLVLVGLIATTLVFVCASLIASHRRTVGEVFIRAADARAAELRATNLPFTGHQLEGTNNGPSNALATPSPSPLSRPPLQSFTTGRVDGGSTMPPSLHGSSIPSSSSLQQGAIPSPQPQPLSNQLQQHLDAVSTALRSDDESHHLGSFTNRVPVPPADPATPNSNDVLLQPPVTVSVASGPPHGGYQCTGAAFDASRVQGPCQDDADVTCARRDAVREAARHAWQSYTKYAWGYDELLPISKSGDNLYGALGATILDAADTMHVMGLAVETRNALAFMAHGLPPETSANRSSVFEATIRCLGGTLGLFELSCDPVAASAAEAVAGRLAGAFQTPSGMPKPFRYGSKGFRPLGKREQTVLADAGTVSMEWSRLAAVTGNASYDTIWRRPIEHMLQWHEQNRQPLLPTHVLIDNTEASLASNTSYAATISAESDSYYEYLLKQWILEGKRGAFVERMRAAWEASMDATLRHLVHATPAMPKTPAEDGAVEGGGTGGDRGAEGGDVRFSLTSGQVDLNGTLRAASKQATDHLSCYAGGMLALGAYHGAVTGEKAAEYMRVAKGITRTCYEMASTTTTGLAYESVKISPSNVSLESDSAHSTRADSASRDLTFRAADSRYLLRPEIVESIFILYRVTGDETYREWGWNMFRSIQAYTRLPNGFARVKSVNADPTRWAGTKRWDLGMPLPSSGKLQYENRQDSFFLAETLKYLFLLFCPSDYLSLNEWVFTTEAHPFRVRN